MTRGPNLVGQVFGRLRVDKRARSTKAGKSTWECLCDCGNRTTVLGTNLVRGLSKSCGCGQHRQQPLELTGQRFGKLTAESSVGSDERGHLWQCRCDCGNSVVVSAGRLRSEKGRKSCGCLPGGHPAGPCATEGCPHQHVLHGRCRRCWNIERRYGITADEWNRRFLAQKGCCAACGKHHTVCGSLHVDHDHLTLLVRGLLCKTCNLALGFVLDSPELLRTLAAYLENAATKP